MDVTQWTRSLERASAHRDWEGLFRFFNDAGGGRVRRCTLSLDPPRHTGLGIAAERAKRLRLDRLPRPSAN